MYYLSTLPGRQNQLFWQKEKYMEGQIYCENEYQL